MEARVITERDRQQAVQWMSQRVGGTFSRDWFAADGVAVTDGELRAVVIVYFEQNAPVAVIGWCMANPDNSPSQSAEAVRLALESAVALAKARNASFMLSYLGNRAMNRMLDDIGFCNADQNVVQKFKYLG